MKISLAVMGFGSQQKTYVIVPGNSSHHLLDYISPGEHPFMTLHTQSTKRRRRLSPREKHLSPVCSYIVTITDHPIIHKRQSETDVGLRFRTTPDSGWLLRTTPDYSGWLRRPQGFSAPSPKTSLALGKLPTRLPVSPVPVLSTSTIAGLGRDSLIYNGGGSSLCWSVACASSPFNSYLVRDL